MPSPSASFEASFGQASQASPSPSASASAWPGLAMVGQLSTSLQTPSRSRSSLPALHESQTSPLPSLSESAWLGFGLVGQLSQTSPTPSPSPSLLLPLAVVGHLSVKSGNASPSALPPPPRGPAWPDRKRPSNPLSQTGLIATKRQPPGAAAEIGTVTPALAPVGSVPPSSVQAL